MTEEERLAAEALAQAAKDEAIAAAIEADPLAQATARAEKAEQERDNYKAVALKRLGKLPGDAEFLGDGTGDESLSVQEQIRIALLDKEVEATRKIESEEKKKLIRENAELKLALKNRPQSSIGGDTTTTVEVKENILTEGQMTELKAQATRLKADPDKYIEKFKQNLQKKGLTQ